MTTVAGQHREIYLDNNATTPVIPEVLGVISSLYRKGPLNPSSVHRAGERARRLLHQARTRLAQLIGASEAQLVFTGGATEANHILLRSLSIGDLRGFRLITSEVEHSSILEAARDLKAAGYDVHLLEVDALGRPDLDDLALRVLPGKTLISLQWANNETGVVQPIHETARLAHEIGALLHSDATQAVGKIPVDIGKAPVDFLSLSAHKFHGPPGAGALFVRRPGSLRPLLRGGGQEDGLRPGTENLPALAGMGIAAEIRRERLAETINSVRALRDDFEAQLTARGIVEAINGGGVERLPNTSNVRFRGIDGEALVLRLDQAGIRCSQSSACTNRKPEPSYVLRAMGLTEDEAYRSVRFSLSEFTTQEEILHVVDTITKLHADLSRFHALTA